MSYLNYNSTAATHNHTLNISDIGYDEVMQTRHHIGKFVVAVKKFVNAPLDSEVIINSGSTESIANMVVWAKKANPYGVICGSELDHTSVKANCDNYDVEYHMLDKSIPKNCSMLFITHVSGKTGEIYDLNNFKKMMSTYAFLSDRDATREDSLQEARGSIVRQYKPLCVMDATQSIDKLKIDMESLKLDALFFSLHKINGPQNYGVLVINNRSPIKFKPLIAGTQQHKLRGGTLDFLPIINAQRFLKLKPMNTMETWKKAVNTLKHKGLEVVEPKNKHLYNTILIKLDTCPLGIIHKLALDDKIYLGAISACSNEEVLEGPVTEGYLRISFTEPTQLTDEIVKKIADTVHEEKEFRLKGGYEAPKIEDPNSEIVYIDEPVRNFEKDIIKDWLSDEELGNVEANEENIGIEFM